MTITRKKRENPPPSVDTSGFRYKVGELVELSSAGRQRDQNNKVYDMMGMVLRIDKLEKYPYIIQWFGYNRGDGTFPMKEYEIKRVRG